MDVLFFQRFTGIYITVYYSLWIYNMTCHKTKYFITLQNCTEWFTAIIHRTASFILVKHSSSLCTVLYMLVWNCSSLHGTTLFPVTSLHNSFQLFKGTIPWHIFTESDPLGWFSHVQVSFCLSGDTIRIGWEIQCLPYAVFFFFLKRGSPWCYRYLK